MTRDGRQSERPPGGDRACGEPAGAETRPPQRGAPCTYRAAVLDALAGHGVIPRTATPPAVARAFLNDLYRYEIRRLRDRLRRGDLPRPAYAREVAALRARYPLLSLPLALWLEPDRESGESASPDRIR